jgi:peptidoglycan/LPS O-acetylase OafA/YrhL
VYASLTLPETMEQVMAWAADSFFYVFRPLAFMIFLNACIQYEEKPMALTSRFCQSAVGLGLFSYSLYLIHMPVLVLFDTFWHSQPLLWRFLLNVPISVAVAWVFFQLVEKHFLLAGKKPPKSAKPLVEASPPHRAAA